MEKILWHGTNETAVKEISKSHFDRGFASGANGWYNAAAVELSPLPLVTIPPTQEPGWHISSPVSAANFGAGVYFALRSEYSAQDRYSRPSDTGVKHMLRVRVVVGKHGIQGKQGMTVLPHGFDAAVDNLSDPKLFVVFHDNAAYPEYVIKFKIIQLFNCDIF